MLEHFIRDEHRTWDTGTHWEVVIDDCYRMVRRTFQESDVVIDVGANIGLFSGLALEKGAGRVIAVEASPTNFLRLEQNLCPYGERARVMNRAVWRSDTPKIILRLHEFPGDGNTGGINVLEDSGEMSVPTIGLDDLIGTNTVTFLKVDCEGSEFPVLYTAKKLDQVRELMIEVHPINHLVRPEFDVRPGQYNPQALAKYLTDLGFQCVVDPREGMGDGWAYVRGVRS